MLAFAHSRVTLNHCMGFAARVRGIMQCSLGKKWGQNVTCVGVHEHQSGRASAIAVSAWRWNVLRPVS